MFNNPKPRLVWLISEIEKLDKLNPAFLDSLLPSARSILADLESLARPRFDRSKGQGGIIPNTTPPGVEEAIPYVEDMIERLESTDAVAALQAASAARDYLSD